MYKVVALGGTFDRLHKGHEYFISQAFGYSHKVIIGLTSNSYVKSKFQSASWRTNFKFQINVDNYEKRKQELEKFLREKKLLQRAEIVKIDDVYGPAATDDKIEALIITVDSYKGARQVNKKRKKLGRKPLQLIRIPLQKADDGKAIASTRIRWGQINRLGKVYMQLPLWGRQIDEQLRQALKSPIGTMIETPAGNTNRVKEMIREHIKKNNPPVLISVGDEVTKLCSHIKMKPDIAIVDFLVQRKVAYTHFSQLGLRDFTKRQIWKVKNKPGSITKTLVSAVYNSMKSWYTKGERSIIKVDGEEDLAGLPAILLSPLGGMIIYGQPNVGIVLVTVSEDIKKRLKNLIQVI